MIVRIGFDVVEVSRISQAMDTEGFRERILTTAELAYCKSAMAVAGRWAAKEAIYKALPTKPVWRDLEIWNGPDGEPEVRVLREGLLPEGCTLHVSISHERGIAGAVAILERLT